MAEDDDIEYCCIEAPHCRLCHFQLKDGELVVAAIRVDRVSTTFAFRRHDTFEDDEEGIAIHLCGRSLCQKRGRRLPCFHDECYGFRPLPITSKFLDATEHRFGPPLRERSRRRGYIQHTFANKLKLGPLKQLPMETCDMVAGYLVRECAIVTSQELALSDNSIDSLVELSRDIYARYVSIEGIPYIQALYNASPSEASPSESEGLRVFKARRGCVVRSIYVKYDHLGIRGVHFDLPRDGPLYSSACGVWWTELSRRNGILCFTAKTDGLKIRDLLDSTDAPPKRNSIVPAPGWPMPGLDCRVIDLKTCQVMRGGLSRIRMSSFDCNAPGTKGYLAGIFGLRLSKIYAHHPGADLPCRAELESVRDSTLWVYMPIDPDEYLEEVWAIWHPSFGCIALMLLTNAERAVLFGAYFPNTGLKFHRIYATTNRPSRVYFNECDPDNDVPWIKYLAFENSEVDIPSCSGTNHKTQYPPSLIPASPPPYTMSTELWYYTGCRMENVAEITCCVDDGKATYKPIVGMMLYYKDGRRSCLGQYRPDLALAPLRIDTAGLLRIRMQKTTERYPCVAEARVQGTADLDSSCWINIPWHGKLEWWFSSRQCTLRHFD
ncbi:hypothetical protein RB597_010128 [Gaeumannomyces tritici]